YCNVYGTTATRNAYFICCRTNCRVNDELTETNRILYWHSIERHSGRQLASRLCLECRNYSLVHSQASQHLLVPWIESKKQAGKGNTDSAPTCTDLMVSTSTRRCLCLR